jgi:hypothetical protein
VLYLISGTILVVGLSSAFLMYRASESQPFGVAGSEAGEGGLYELNPEYSKQYLRALELYGGQANVLAYEIREWFVGLWHGKSLAYIVAARCCHCRCPRSVLWGVPFAAVRSRLPTIGLFVAPRLLDTNGDRPPEQGGGSFVDA